ncbi:hypothetical protein JOD31_001560 [Methylopila capsulata]|uniref:Uncharacterized protein n=1 Tax=Methylopila capsulata TaxID=61654 RepID=A0A9W6IQ05_9HYPH|nr:hypothetical protein [Methylopila capsulata]MBM7851335.1 hypothetical protein [Methylopila capsulata]GLK54393.1 hypothetical protein GCM10008170_04120 [Methylopila capsulata]
MAEDGEFQESDRPEVDHDTRGLGGTPDIAAGIMTKIEAAAVFVADVTPVAATDPAALRPDLEEAVRPAPKYVQNPNVMSELGYADRAIGASRIVLVANAFHYPGPDALPFDWRHRRGPITYNLADNASTSDIRAARAVLSRSLKAAIEPLLREIAVTTAAPAPLLRVAPENADSAVWQGARDIVRFVQNGGDAFAKLAEGPKLYTRVAPGGQWTPPSRNELTSQMQRENAYLSSGGGSTSGSNDKGAFAATGLSTPVDGIYPARGITQWFRDNGEFWGVDTTPFSSDGGVAYFAYRATFPWIARFLQAAIDGIRHFAPEGPIEIELGASGLLETYFPGELRFQRMRSVGETAVVKARHTEWSAQQRATLLFKFWNEIKDAYGLAPCPGRTEYEAETQHTLPADPDL